MERKLLLRGALAGTVGGLLAFVFARLLAEPLIQQAVDYEEGRAEASEALHAAAGHSHAEGGEVFSRAVQANLGLGLGVVLFGAAVGLLLAVAYTLSLGRVGGVRPRRLALLLAGAGFVALYLVPFLKYPANPPAIGHEETIRQRGELYLLMVLVSVVLLVLAVWLGRTLQHRIGTWNASVAAGLAFCLGVGVVMALLPSLGHLALNQAQFGDQATETPQPLTDDSGRIVFPGFPADVLAQFRLYAVGAQLVLWTTIALVFAPLADRVLRPVTTRPVEVPAGR